MSKLMKGMFAAQFPVGDGDPYWSKVVSLLHFDGDLTDEKGEVWSYHLSGTIDTIDPIFGTGSLSNNGIQGGAIGMKERIDTSKSWTIEGFVYCTNTAAHNIIYISMPISGTVINAVQFFIYPPGLLHFQIYGISGVSSYQQFVSTGPPIPLNVATHVAVTYDKITNTLRIFQAGQKVLEESVNVTWNATHPRGLATWLATGFPARYLRGSLDEWRETVGVARYTENFTPPTEPFPNY